MKFITVMVICLGSLLFASCDTKRTDTNAENAGTEGTPLENTDVPVPPPPSGTNPASDRGQGTGPGTGVVETGEFDGGKMIDVDSINAVGTGTGERK